MKPHISDILKPGAKLSARILDKKKVNKLIKKTQEEQQKIIDRMKKPNPHLNKPMDI